MVFYYVTIFEENGRYYPQFDLSQGGQRNAVRIGRRVDAKQVYQGEIRDINQGKTVNNFVSEANKTREFDSKRLEELLNN